MVMRWASLLMLVALITLSHVGFVLVESGDSVGYATFNVEEVTTRVYGLKLLKLPTWMKYSKAVIVEDSVILSGSGFMAKLNLGNKTLEWVHSILGNATSMSVESKPARWVAVGTDLGEAVVVSLIDPGLKLSFYTASRASVRDVSLANVNDGVRLLVLDDEGFLYVMRILRGALGGGWFEAGPVPHRGALTGLYGFKVVSVHPAVLANSWSSYSMLGDRVVALTNIVLPWFTDHTPLLGGFTLEVLYRDGGLLTPAYVGSFNISPNLVEVRSLYYAIGYDKYLVPLRGASTGGNIYKAESSTIRVEGLPPHTYNVLVMYEVKVTDRVSGVTFSSRCYAGIAKVKVTPGGLTWSDSLILEHVGVNIVDCINYLRLREYYVARAMQALLLLNLTRLPESFDYERDGKIILLPIPEELIDSGVTSLNDYSVALLFKPGLGIPAGWDVLGVDSIFLVSVGGWLLIYYIGVGFNLADMGYMQPQTVYLGSRVTSIAVSPDASRIYLGLSSGALFKLEWLRARPWQAPEDTLRNRYFIDSSLELGGGPVTSVIEVTRGVVMASTAGGRLQLARVDDVTGSLKPAWRGPPGFEGVDTGLSDVVFGLSSPNVMVAYASGLSDKLYLFRGRLEELQPLVITITPVSFRDDGSWFIASTPEDLVVSLEDHRGVTMASDRVVDGRATLYVPQGFYRLTLRSSWGVALVNITVNMGFNERTVILVQEPGGRAYAELLREGVTVEDVIKRRPPRADITLRFIDVDGNPVNVKLRVSIEGPGYRGVTITDNGLATFNNVPLGAYKVLVEPIEGYYEKFEGTIRVTVRGANPNVLELRPLTISITLKFVDKQFKTLISEPILVKLERLEAGSQKLLYPREVRVVGEAKLQLPMGTYRATLIPAGRDLYIMPRDVRFMVEKPGDVTVELQPKTFTLTIQVRDAWGNPLSNAKIVVERVDGLLRLDGESDANGVLTLSIPHGVYDVRVSKRWFKDRVTSISITSDDSIEIKLEPSLIAYIIKFSPYIVSVTGAMIALSIILWARRIVSERLREEYF